LKGRVTLHALECPIEPHFLVLQAAVLAAAVIDARTRRIPNALTLPLVPAGLVLAAVWGPGLSAGLLGATVAFALHFALWQLGLEGAGDAKLMIGVGAVGGWELVLEATGWRYLLLIPYAVALITALGRWASFGAAAQWTLLKAQGVDAGERPTPAHVPFGPLVAAGVLAAIHTSWLTDLWGWLW
jgi:Flp pilus assembly protein protease CpaA